MVDCRVEHLEKPIGFFLRLEPLVTCDVGEADHLAFLIVEH